MGPLQEKDIKGSTIAAVRTSARLDYRPPEEKAACQERACSITCHGSDRIPTQIKTERAIQPVWPRLQANKPQVVQFPAQSLCRPRPKQTTWRSRICRGPCSNGFTGAPSQIKGGSQRHEQQMLNHMDGQQFVVETAIGDPSAT